MTSSCFSSISRNVDICVLPWKLYSFRSPITCFQLSNNFETLHAKLSPIAMRFHCLVDVRRDLSCIAWLAGDIGGSMGLFIGASVITVFELADVIIHNVFRLYCCKPWLFSSSWSVSYTNHYNVRIYYWLVHNHVEAENHFFKSYLLNTIHGQISTERNASHQNTLFTPSNLFGCIFSALQKMYQRYIWQRR